MEHLCSNYNPLILRVKRSSHSNWDEIFFKKKTSKNSCIGPYIWISCDINIKKWAGLGHESHLNVKKYLSFSQDFGNWRKNLTMVFELMVSLCIEICSTFVIFNIWVDWSITVILENALNFVCQTGSF